VIRGWYTGASGMTAQQIRLDALSNNLANVDTDGYKRDVAVHKSFPQMLLRRMNDDGVWLHPLGSTDLAPVVGTIGMGVETNELFTEFEQGAMKQTENDFDFALDGKGFMVVRTPDGERYTRNGSFVLGKEGYLETKEGLPVMGENGAIRVKANNFTVDKDGRVWVNNAYQDDNPENLVGREQCGARHVALHGQLPLRAYLWTQYPAAFGHQHCGQRADERLRDRESDVRPFSRERTKVPFVDDASTMQHDDAIGVIGSK
jgi:flagellar hook-basal body protein